MKKIIFITVFTIGLLFGAYDSVGTDYDQTQVSEHASDSALDTLNIVNMVLGYIHDSKADHFINKGPYKALMKGEESGGGASSGSGVNTKVEKLQPMTLEVTRDTNLTADPNPPMIVKFWLDDPNGVNDEPMRVVGYIKITQGVSSEYPFGKMRIDIKGYPIDANGSTNATEVLRAAIDIDKSSQAGKADIRYIEQESNGSGGWLAPQILNLTYDAAGTYSSAFTTALDWDTGSYYSYEMALSSDYYKLQEVNSTNIVSRNDLSGNSIQAYDLVGSAICKSKTDFIKNVYRYALFNSSTGERVALNAGFPIKKTDGTNTYYGYVGYWGIWSENDAIQSGDTVKREETGESYKVFQTLGKLIKHTKATTTMEKLDKSKLYFWSYALADPSINGSFVIHWDKDANSGNGAFVLDGLQVCDSSGCDTNTSIVNDGNTSITKLNINNWSTAWSDALQSNIPIDINFTNSSEVAYHKQEVIVPDHNLTLVNYGYTIINPDMNLSSAANYVPEAIDENGTNGVIGRTYFYEPNQGALLDLNDSNKSVLIPLDTNWTAVEGNVTHPWWKWGAQMGPLLEANSTAVTSGTYNDTNFWQVEQNETVYYTWETGLNSWNKATVLLDSSGQPVTFDPPMDIVYTHKTANDLNGDSSHDSQVYILHYDGNSLGLPWDYNATYNTWMPSINIKSGTIVGDSDQYVVKAIGIDDTPVIVDCTSAGTLNLDPSKDVNASFVPVRNDNNSTLLELNTTVVGTLVNINPPDANVSVVKGKLLQ